MSSLSPALTIAAAFASKDPFLWATDNDLKADMDLVKTVFADGTSSDHIAIVKAFNSWACAEAEERRVHAWRNMLSPDVLERMSHLRAQFADLLAQSGFIPTRTNWKHDPDSLDQDLDKQGLNQNASNIAVIRAILCSGLYPNVASIDVKTSRKKNGDVKTKTDFKTVNDGVVNLHLSSVNAGNENIDDYPWMIYSGKMRFQGEKTNLMNTTLLSNETMTMFGGDLVKKEAKNKYRRARGGSTKLSMADGFYNFRYDDQRHCEIICEVRKRLDELLDAKVENPNLDLNEYGKDIFDALLVYLEGAESEGDPYDQLRLSEHW